MEKSEQWCILSLLKEECDAIKLRCIQEKMEYPGIEGDKLLEQKVKSIISTEKVKKILSWQNEDGSFSSRMHTPVSNSKIWAHEGCMRYLADLGLTEEFEPVKRGLDFLRQENWSLELKGNAAEAFGCGAIRAALFARFGLENETYVQQMIENALQSFRFIDQAKTPSDICVPYKDKYVYADGTFMPNIYLLRVLAFTDGWRNKENVAMLKRTYEKLYRWLPLPPTYIKIKSQLVAAPRNLTEAYNQDFSAEQAIIWFEFYELSARMGLLTKDSPFYVHIERLLNNVLETASLSKDNDSIEKEIMSKKRYFLTWSGYSGIALEEKWNTIQKEKNDLFFRCALILQYMNLTDTN